MSAYAVAEMSLYQVDAAMLGFKFQAKIKHTKYAL
jgi:hypothetical protein